MGDISYEAEENSFGMLVMEITGKRKNNNMPAENSRNETYFPNWVYDQVKGKFSDPEISKEMEMKLVKKMITVALWCTRMRPSDCPSMN